MPSTPESEETRVTDAEVEAILDRRNHRDLLLAGALKDLIWKATPFTFADDETITSYIVPAGTMHRLAGQAQQFGADFRVTIAFRAVEVSTEAAAALHQPPTDAEAIDAVTEVLVGSPADPFGLPLDEGEARHKARAVVDALAALRQPREGADE